MRRPTSLLLAALVLTLFFGLTSNAAAFERVQGTIKTVDPVQKQITITDQTGTDWFFLMDTNATLQVAAIPAKLSDFLIGDRVEVRYRKDGPNFIAIDVNADR